MMKIEINKFDIYNELDQSWFDQIGTFDQDAFKYAPVYCVYVTTSFHENINRLEALTLFVDEELEVFYIRTHTTQPTGEYDFLSIFGWYISKPNKFEEIKNILETRTILR